MDPVLHPLPDRRALIERLAALAALRDREALDQGLVGLLAAVSGAVEVRVCRLVGAASDLRWWTRAAWDAASPGLHMDPPWADLRDLPVLEDQPHWAAAVRGTSVPGGLPEGLLVRPVATLDELQAHPSAPVGVVVVRGEGALAPAARLEVEALLTFYRNMIAVLDYSECDTLTGLNNRKSFDESFYKASALPLAGAIAADGGDRRHPARRLQYWLAVIDVDHFKQVNDRFGHLLGDEVLMRLARIMRASFRFHDQLFRFGGEEFLVLLRCEHEADAATAFERFRQAVESASFPQVGQVTASVGFTDVRAGDTPQAAVDRADRAVYQSKKQGRNRVSSFANLVAEGTLEERSSSGDIEFF